MPGTDMVKGVDLLARTVDGQNSVHGTVGMS